MAKFTRIHLDATSISVVVTCADCPSWQAFRFTREEGWRAAREHELNVHPGSRQATTALAYWANTHAED